MNTLRKLLAIAQTQAKGQGAPANPNFMEGVCVAGSYDPAGVWEGGAAMPSASFVIGDSYGAATDANNMGVVRATLLTTQIGDQAGLIGGERAILFRVPSGWAAMLEHGPDDSPQAPLGERWIAHRDPGTGEFNAFIKATNDGATAGDGMGGMALVTSAAGIGDLFSNLTPDEANIVHANLRDLAGSIMADMMQSFTNQFTAALVTASAGATTPTQQALALQAIVTVANWIVDNVTPPTIPLGSAVARTANP